MQLRLLSFLFLLFSSLAFGMPNEVCMDALNDISPQLEKNIWPSFNELVCKKNKCPNWKNYPFVENEVIKPLFGMLGDRGLKLPPYSGDIKKLFDSIAKDCFQKQETNFCNLEEVKETRSCVFDKGMGFIMTHLDWAKYGSRENCEIAMKCVKDPEIWTWGKEMVGKFARERIDNCKSS